MLKGVGRGWQVSRVGAIYLESAVMQCFSLGPWATVRKPRGHLSYAKR